LLSFPPNAKKGVVDSSVGAIMFDGSKIEELPAINGIGSESGANGESGEITGCNQGSTAKATEEHQPEVENHANRLLDLLNELRSLADAALREAECADRIEEALETEINGLLERIKEKDESIDAYDQALAKLEETSKAELSELQSRIQEHEIQLSNREIQAQQLVSERDYLINRLKEAEFVAGEAEARVQQHTERMEAEFTELRLQLSKHEESLAARELALCRHEGDLRTSIHNLQLRLQDTEAKLAGREREIKQKEALIEAAATREARIGRLIERLSSECEKLSTELCEKRLIFAQLEDKRRHSTNGGRMWKKVLGLVQEEAF
jgi:chromosome segregation ATPase